MGIFDQASELKVAPVHILAEYAASTSIGQTVDTKDFGSMTFIIIAGTLQVGQMDFRMEEAPDDGTGIAGAFTTVDSEDIIGTIPTLTTLDDNNLYRVGYSGKQRFVRIVALETIAFNNFNMCVIAILGNSDHIPYVQTN